MAVKVTVVEADGEQDDYVGDLALVLVIRPVEEGIAVQQLVSGKKLLLPAAVKQLQALNDELKRDLADWVVRLLFEPHPSGKRSAKAVRQAEDVLRRLKDTDG